MHLHVYNHFSTKVNLDANACICIMILMIKKPNENTTRAWIALMRAQHQVRSKVEAALKKGDLPSLSWYDVLWELERGAEVGTRPYELEQHLLLPQYGLSRLLNRMETAGYIERHPCDEDGRGHVITITKFGKDTRQKMWPLYAAALQDGFGSKLNDQEAIVLSNLLNKLVKV